MKYPKHYPVKDLWKPEAPENENWRLNWETPLKSTNRELAEMLREAAQSLESEHGFCSQSFAIREAEHRLRHTLDAPPVRTLPMEWRQMANHCSPGAHDALLIVADRLEKECRKSVNQADECRRVLKPGGTFIFKWCEHEIPLREILALTPHKPLYGHRTGAREKTHWVAFIKHNVERAHGA